MDPAACVICDARTDLVVGIVQWQPPVEPRWQGGVTRCRDRAACAERVRAEGKPWPVIEKDWSKPEADKPDPKFRPSSEATARRREYDEYVRSHPDMVDTRPPVRDPATGTFRFLPPKPLPEIPTIPETERRPVVVSDDPTTWW
jgi:hypothetical protein